MIINGQALIKTTSIKNMMQSVESVETKYERKT